MDNYLMIEKLKRAGLSFGPGLSDEEFSGIESTFGFRFPSEIRAFLACAVPVGDEFFNWRDLSDANNRRFHDFHAHMDDVFRFDLEDCGDTLRALLSERLSGISDTEAFAQAVLDDLHQSTTLIPFYAHRCFFDGMDNMPIVSFWQAVDTIFYGENFEDYLETEFLGKCHCINQIPARMEDTGIWHSLIL